MARILTGHNDDGTEIWGDDGTGTDSDSDKVDYGSADAFGVGGGWTADEVFGGLGDQTAADAWLSSLATGDSPLSSWYDSAGNLTPEAKAALTPQMKENLLSSNSATAAINRLFGIGGPTGTDASKGAISGAALGLGGTGILSALAALTSKPSTTSGTTSQTNTTGQTTSGSTSQTQNQTQKVGYEKWYEDLVKSAATGLPTKGYESFDKDMLNLPNGRAIADYMNPYMAQVAAPIMRRQAEDQAGQLQKFNAERVSRGAFGSGRSDILQNQLLERQALERDNTLSGVYGQAFNNATGLASTDLGRSFEDWKLLQGAGAGTIGAAGAQANVLKTLAPGATTTATGGTVGTTGGKTTGTTGTTGTTSYTGADPSRLGQLAGIGGTIWAMANPNGLKA